MTNSNPWTLWFIVAVAAIAGYFVVSKAIDFFRRGSVWEEQEPGAAPQAGAPEEEQERRFESNEPLG
jgi:hypothetical protein